MRVAVIGRTRMLIEAARRIHERGHTIPLVWTCRAEAFYGTDENDFARLAHSLDAMFFTDVGINKPENLGRLADVGCDVAISMNWLTIIGPPVLALFRHGVLNAHAGDLPRYRGNACPNWAILSGEPHVGLCVHQMAPELDAGPVLLRDRFPLGPRTDIGDVYEWLDRRIPAMLADAVDGLATGTLTPQSQPANPSLALRTYPRRPEDARIDWSWPVQRIDRLIRASSRPFDGAFSYLEGRRRLIVWRAAPIEHTGAFLAVPGQICFETGGDPVVACGDGLLRLIDIDLCGEAGRLSSKQTLLSSLRNRLTEQAPP